MDDFDDDLKAPPPTRRHALTRRTTTLIAISAFAVVASSSFPECAHAVSSDAGFTIGGGGSASFVGAPDFASDEYVYRTPDLAVDLASPLVAYWCVTKALKQEIPVWLEGIIFFAALGATYVCVTDNHSLDSILV